MTTLRVFRWSEPAGERVDTFDVATGLETTVLDALVETQRTQDSTLAFRYACRVGMCGSCAMVVNGRERWACRTRLAQLDAETVTVRPLYHFPLIRDLVVDMTPFRDRMAAVGGVLTPAADAQDYAIVGRDSRERREIDEAIECIGCGMCVSVCTLAADDARFPGPAALNRAFTLQLDHRDDAHAARWSVLLGSDALGQFRRQMAVRQGDQPFGVALEQLAGGPLISFAPAGHQIDRPVVPHRMHLLKA